MSGPRFEMLDQVRIVTVSNQIAGTVRQIRLSPMMGARVWEYLVEYAPNTRTWLKQDALELVPVRA